MRKACNRNLSVGADDGGYTNCVPINSRALVRIRSDPVYFFSCVFDMSRYSWLQMMMMTFITQGGEGRGNKSKKSKATKSKGGGLEGGASRALMRQVGEEGCGGRGSHDRYNVSSVPQAALEDPEGQ